MAKPNLSFEVYGVLEYLPILIACFAIMILVCFLQCLQYCATVGSEGATNIISFIYEKLCKLSKVVFGPPAGLFDKQKGSSSKDVYINGKPVPNCVLFILGGFMINFGFMAAFLFWDIFLIQGSSACDDDIDCFISSISTVNGSEVYTNDPISDCSEFTDNKNITIKCYRFVYQFGTGLAAVGGLITAVKILMKLISAIFIYIYSQSGRKICCCRLSVIFLIITHALFVPILFVGSWTAIQVLVGFLNLSISTWIQIIFYTITVVTAFSIPWCIFVGKDEEEEEDG